MYRLRDEMSTLIQPSNLDHNSHLWHKARKILILRHVTCMMIVAAVSCLYATEKLRQDGLSHCAQSRAGRRVVEHSYSRRLAWFHPLRPIPEEPEHRAQHAAPPLERLS